MIETKRKSLILNVVLTAIILLIGILFWPNKEKFNQSNPKDSNKTQIKVKVKALNIRKEATTESEDLGTVYYDEIFTVISHVDKADYYWYRIKTKQGITGYLASDKESPYVEVISGYIDRTPPVITSSVENLVFVNGERDYTPVTCEDEYSSCILTHDESDSEYITFKGVDKDNNETKLKVRYYNVYSIDKLYNDNDENIKANILKTNEQKKFIFETDYFTKKIIFNENKSKEYLPKVEFYDEEFHLLEDIFVRINEKELDEDCINTKENKLKDSYLKNDLLKGSKLCFNYSFDKDNEIEYIRFGFDSTDNQDNQENVFASYNSKYFIIKEE